MVPTEVLRRKKIIATMDTGYWRWPQDRQVGHFLL